METPWIERQMQKGRNFVRSHEHLSSVQMWLPGHAFIETVPGFWERSHACFNPIPESLPHPDIMIMITILSLGPYQLVMHWFEAAQILILILILIQMLKQPLHLLALGFHPEKACKSHLGRVRLTHWCSLRIARPLHAQDKNICAKIIFVPKILRSKAANQGWFAWTMNVLRKPAPPNR